jgi:hypothetical protein
MFGLLLICQECTKKRGDFASEITRLSRVQIPPPVHFNKKGKFGRYYSLGTVTPGKKRKKKR